MRKVVENCEDMCDKIGRTPYFYITGGDPILHRDFWKLAELLKAKGITWGIPENFIARAFMLLGYCEGDYPHSKPRRNGCVVIVDED